MHIERREHFDLDYTLAAQVLAEMDESEGSTAPCGASTRPIPTALD